MTHTSPELQKLIEQFETRTFETAHGTTPNRFTVEVEEKFNDSIIHILIEQADGPQGIHAIYATDGAEAERFQEFLEELDRRDETEARIGGAYTWLTEVLVSDYQERIVLGWGDWIVGDNRIRHAQTLEAQR